ncbi:N-terminal nucleophile aminohydrolase [Pseudovirgaria hyperparasitica]|uniref:N-terminal nucleophile aminohydrolase n=1 Tax=Pseudovirgaria hyperparasitica TaxID=470096 RepID=A0A6A6WBL2_9PEZI|nr:N-terminal nucleophile aminohydrolase [Pseudovirgaria hyperparasitica]KAF2759226.1 N-terminal nucleophile aminohydrolase [Pseudovirgaria hyperparasitica]
MSQPLSDDANSSTPRDPAPSSTSTLKAIIHHSRLNNTNLNFSTSVEGPISITQLFIRRSRLSTTIEALPPSPPLLSQHGTGYDLTNSVFSPDGRNFQVEYAVKAVENGGTAIGIRCKDGVVLALEKLVTSKLLKPNANKRISTIDRNMGVVSSGLLPDARHFVSRSREEAASWRQMYKAPIPVSALADRMGQYTQAYTLFSSVRPFGVTSIIAGWDSEAEVGVDGQVGSGPSIGAGGKQDIKKKGGPYLYMIEPSGMYWAYYGAATGKGRQSAKSELEKLDLAAGELSLEQGIKEAARIIYVAHEDSKDKEFELEMCWVSSLAGPTKGRFEEVPKDLREEAEKLAKKAIEGDDDEDEEKMET